MARYARWMVATLAVLLALGWACGTERGGTGIRALLRGVPTHCDHSILTVQVENRLQTAVNVYQAQGRYDLRNVRSGLSLARNVTRDATEVMCLDPVVGQQVRIVVDPVGGDPYLIPGAGAVFFDGTQTLNVRVMDPITLSTLEVY